MYDTTGGPQLTRVICLETREKVNLCKEIMNDPRGTAVVFMQRTKCCAKGCYIFGFDFNTFFQKLYYLIVFTDVINVTLTSVN